MSLLKRLEHGGVSSAAPAAPAAAEPAVHYTPSSTPAEATFRASPVQTQATEAQRSLKDRVKRKLISELDPSVDTTQIDEVRQRLKLLFDQIIEAENLVLTRAEKERLFEELAADVIGFGPIEPLLNDPSVSEVMVNGPKKIYFERKGRLQLSDIQFDDDEHVRRVIDRIVSPLGRHVDEASPIVDARLPDGSRVNVVIPPISLVGPTITIRKFTKEKLRVDDLIRFGSITPEIADFLRACVTARLNVVISGGTGSGKTTLLNVLSNFIPDDERIVSIEDSAELQLAKDHWVRLETRPANIEGSGAVTARDCMKSTLRMRPDRVIVGECRGGEALDMLQAMNTGHDGSLTTGHANSPRDMLSRLETMVLMAGMDLPVRAIREQISSAVDLIVQQSRMRDGSRKVTHISEVQGMEGDKIILQDVFLFEQEAFENGKVIGAIKPTGVRPKFMPKLEEAGIQLPPSIFGLAPGFF
jgi:pilus assembly protein CpaF